MSTLDDALQQLAALFEGMGITYAVMGGLAVGVHGIPRPTHDLDVTIAIERDDLKDLYTAAEELGYTVPDVYHTGRVDEIAGMSLVKFRLYLEGHGIDVDVFLAESPFQSELLSRRQSIALGDKSVWLVSPEDLVLLKLLASRPRDIADIGDILFTQGALDEAYLRHWANILGVQDELDAVLANPPL